MDGNRRFRATPVSADFQLKAPNSPRPVLLSRVTAPTYIAVVGAARCVLHHCCCTIGGDRYT
eukprot:988401-Alexandrium_andersonii.AAC.1